MRLDRGRCTFKHDPASVQQQSAQNSIVMMSEEQHRQIVDFAAANGKDAWKVTLEDSSTITTPLK